MSTSAVSLVDAMPLTIAATVLIRSHTNDQISLVLRGGDFYIIDLRIIRLRIDRMLPALHCIALCGGGNRPSRHQAGERRVREQPAEQGSRGSSRGSADRLSLDLAFASLSFRTDYRALVQEPSVEPACKRTSQRK
jgi:hypothetical protein